MQPLISVIVPVYKVEPYLDKCVESIVNQTYKNFEIILVDDGSPDNCPAMCDDWAVKDSRIKVIHKQNGGQAEARNFGMKAATGEYIGFVDSDDWIDKTMYEHLMKLAIKYRADIVECGMFLFKDWACSEISFSDDEIITTFNRKDAVRHLIDESYFKCTAPNKLVRSDIAMNVMFDVGKINEDILWPYRAFNKAKTIVHTNRRLYAYYQRPGSTMNSGFTEKRMDGIDALEIRAREVKSDIPELYPLAERVYLGSCFYHYRALCRDKQTEGSKRLKQILYKRYLQGDRKTAFEEAVMKWKIFYKLFAVAPNLASGILNKLKIGL